MRNPFRPSVDDAVNIEDLRRLARQRVPDAVFDYIDGGADGEVTLRDNRRSWDEVLFRPRNAVRIPACDTTTDLFGARLWHRRQRCWEKIGPFVRFQLADIEDGWLRGVVSRKS